MNEFFIVQKKFNQKRKKKEEFFPRHVSRCFSTQINQQQRYYDSSLAVNRYL